MTLQSGCLKIAANLCDSLSFLRSSASYRYQYLCHFRCARFHESQNMFLWRFFFLAKIKDCRHSSARISKDSEAALVCSRLNNLSIY